MQTFMMDSVWDEYKVCGFGGGVQEALAGADAGSAGRWSTVLSSSGG